MMAGEDLPASSRALAWNNRRGWLVALTLANQEPRGSEASHPQLKLPAVTMGSARRRDSVTEGIGLGMQRGSPCLLSLSLQRWPRPQ